MIFVYSEHVRNTRICDLRIFRLFPNFPHILADAVSRSEVRQSDVYFAQLHV